MARFLLLAIVTLAGIACQEEEEDPELAPLDGYFNNLIHPDWGAAETVLLRKSPTAYADGVYHMAGPNRPNPFEISSVAHRGPMGLPSQRGRNAMITYFGQQVVEEIMDVQRPGCPREFENIDVPLGHDLYDPDRKGNIQQPFLRSRFDQRTGQSPSNPRQQLNEITPFLDGQLMYGPARTWADAIREFRGGNLLSLDPTKGLKESFPVANNIRLPFANPPNPRENGASRRLQPVSRFWRLGNPRGFENPFLLSFGVMWFRLHNYFANETRVRNGWASEDDQIKYDERIFNEARKKVTAIHQKIVLYDWLPRWLEISENGTIMDKDEVCGRYTKYNPDIHPGISHEFQTSAMRFGHTLVTPGLWRRGVPQEGVALNGSNSQQVCNWLPTTLKVPGREGDSVHAIRLCNAYWNSQESVTDDVDAIYRGMASTLAEQEDHIMVADLAGDVFGPLEFSRRDLAAINIQRGRDHGLPDYQAVRQTFGLPRRNTWEEINNATSNVSPRTAQAIQNLRSLYRANRLNSTSPEDVDLFTGGLLETTFDGPGELFKAIFKDQFCRIRNGDRFWYENKENGLFNETGIEEINNWNLRRILLVTTNLQPTEFQEDPFLFTPGDPCPQPAQLVNGTETQVNGNTRTIIEDCTAWQTYDYFSGSEVSFPLTFLFLGLCVPLTFAVMYCMAKQRMKKLRVTKKDIKQTSSDPNVFYALEWVGPHADDRQIKIFFDANRRKIHVYDKSGKRPLRMLDLRSRGEHIINTVHVWIEVDKKQNYCSVRLTGEIDLVLRFSDSEAREQFLNHLKRFLQGLAIDLNRINMNQNMMFESAETKEKRQHILDQFFKVVSFHAFKDKSVGDFGVLDQETMKKIAHIQLTRTEFAEAFGLKPTSLFVRNMFLLVDRDKSGFVSFREFLDLFVVLSSSNATEKARLIFNMYDVRGKGVLSKGEFKKMIKSLLDLSESTIDQNKLDNFISAMYQQSGIPEGSEMNFDAFQRIFNAPEYSKTLEDATLQLDGFDEGNQGRFKKSSLRHRAMTVKKSYEEGDVPHRQSMVGVTVKKPKTNPKTVKPITNPETIHLPLRSKGKKTVRFFKRAKESVTMKRKSAVHVKTFNTEYPQTRVQQLWFDFSSWVATYRLLIFWTTLYTLVLIGIFVERAVYYSFEREHVGLRRIAGYGVTTTRGAASAMMFTYSSLLVTMSRNMITFFRETFLHRFFPWDGMHFLHKYIAFLALFFTVVHSVGHGINLYHISTQSSGDLNCIFREYFRATHILASFHYWAYTTITGITGIILVLIVIVIYVYALPFARRHVFKWFWRTHNLYILLYLFTVLHGSGRLVQEPLFQWFFIGPLIVFVIDKLISISRNKIEIRVLKAEQLPSDVTALVFKRPRGFDYKSGQWVRIAALRLGEGEYHPFTLTSAPHEENLSLHIRAVGPWTTNLRNLCDPDRVDRNKPMKLYLDGPYGEGHQDWYRYDVAVLVGGGIGVTPFASILKDIVHKSKIADLRFPCKKVYFLWVTRTQKQFEWMTDIIREVETVDTRGFVDVHIFITQFKQKFDFRTTMLYICERHFQKVAGKSLFTGLSAVTHFGRPVFQDILRSISMEHQNVNVFGVFSCGPGPLTSQLDRECTALNKVQGAIFQHHFENF